MYVDLTGLITVASVAVVFTLFLRVYSKESVLFCISLLAVAVLVYFRSGDVLIFLIAYVSAITALMLYSRRFYIPFGILFFLSAVEIYRGNPASLSLSISLGTAISLLMSNLMISRIEHNEYQKGTSSNIEIRRDLFQIACGVAALAILYLFRLGTAESVIVILLLLLYILGNYSYNNRSSPISAILHTIERKNVDLGLGSLMAAVGVLFMFGLVSDLGVVLLGMFLVMIADPVATIAGKLIGGTKLPYNRNKSFSGFLIALLSAAVFAIYTGGAFFILYAIVGTFTESATKKPIDDNLTIPLSVVALHYFISIF